MIKVTYFRKLRHVAVPVEGNPAPYGAPHTRKIAFFDQDEIGIQPDGDASPIRQVNGVGRNSADKLNAFMQRESAFI